MRLHLKINADNLQIPFEHQALLVGTIHKWLGWNNEHGEVSLYSFSRLNGGKKNKNELKFDRFATLFISAHEQEIVKKVLAGIQQDPTMFFGLTVVEVEIQEDPDFSSRDLFMIGSPILIKRRNEDKMEQILFDDSRASKFLKETLLTKMQKVGLEDDSLNIYFDTTYPKAGTKMITYKGIKNKASWCPIIIKGKAETKLFAWNVGLGNSTGIGFGAII